MIQKKKRSGCIALAVVVALAGSVPALASAQPTYPSRPIRLVVPFAPGGTTDILARSVAPAIAAKLGQPVIVDNKAGAGGAIGAAEVARAAPDGYTLGLATVSTTASNPAINPKTPYDPVKDFAAIVNLAETPNVLAVHPSFPATDFGGFVKTVSGSPGKFSYASSGTGGIGHLQTELFKSLTGLSMTHVAYRGAGPALTDVVAGQVPVIFDNLPSALPFIKEGRLRAVAVAAPSRLESLPGVATFKELGLEPVNRPAYYGLVAPRGTPAEIVAAVHAAAVAALADPAVKRRIVEAGATPVGGTPAQFEKQIREELEVYRKVVTSQRLTLE